MVTKQFRSALESLSAVRQAVESFCSQSGIPDVVEGELELAINEVCTNIVEHGGLNPEKDSFQITFEKEDNAVILTIQDKGKRYDFNNSKGIKTSKEMLKKRPRSGMGVFIIRQLVDAVIYNHLADKTNELKLVKYLTK